MTFSRGTAPSRSPSDGTRCSTTTRQGARGAVIDSGAAVFALGLRHKNQLDSTSVSQLVNRAGGQMFIADNWSEMPAAISSVQASLGHQYVVNYPSQVKQGQVGVAVTVADQKVEASYVAGAVSQGAARVATPTASKPFGPAFLRGSAGGVLAFGMPGLAAALLAYAVALLLQKQDGGLAAILRPYSETVVDDDPVNQGLAQTALLQRAVELTEGFAERQGLLSKVEAKLERPDLPTASGRRRSRTRWARSCAGSSPKGRLGRDLEDSLDGVAERMDSPDFAWAVMAVRIQREVGCNLAELLMTVAETMTQRDRLRRDVSTLTAEEKISAIVLGLLPVGLGGAMWAINPDYMSVLFSDTMGQIMLGVAIVAALIGFAWITKPYRSRSDTCLESRSTLIAVAIGVGLWAVQHGRRGRPPSVRRFASSTATRSRTCATRSCCNPCASARWPRCSAA